jgi:CxxC-x17-CxxC domain-containing protein
VTFGDKILKCSDCNNEFVFTAGEQEFYALKGFQNEPKRCPACRTVRRADTSRRPSRSSGGGGGFGGGNGAPMGDRGPRRLYPAICASCGRETQVPFEPKGIKPVYCSDCFSQQRTGPARSSWR